MRKETNPADEELIKLKAFLQFYQQHKQALIKKLTDFEERFDTGHVTLTEYHALMDHILGGRTVEDLVKYY